MATAEIALQPGRETNIKAVFFLSLIWGLCSGFYNVILQPFIVDFVDSEFIFGVIMTVALFAQILPMILVGKVSDRIGRKRVHMVGFFLYVPAMILFALSGQFDMANPLFLIVSALLLVNIGFGAMDPAFTALVAESSQENKRASTFSILGLGVYASALIGPIVIRLLAGSVPLHYYFYGLIGGYTIYFLFQLFQLRESLSLSDFTTNFGKQFIQSSKALVHITVQFFVSITHFIVMPFLLFFRKSSEEKLTNQFLRNVEREMSLFEDIFKTKGVKYAIGYFIFDSFVYGLSLNIYNGAVKYVYAYTESQIATMQLVLSLSTIIFFIPLTKISDKFKRKEMLVMSQLAGSLFFTTNIIAHFTLPEYRLYVILIGWAGLGVSIAFWVPSVLSILSDFDKKRRAEVYGMVSGIKSLGWLPTGIIAGFIIEKTIDTMGLLVPFLISTVLFPITLFLSMRFPENDTRKNSENDDSIKKADEEIQHN
jgi:MFS family permease